MDDNVSDNDNMMQTQVDEETNVNDSDDNDVYNDVSDGGWIQWFCGLEGNEFFVEIDEEFLRNRSNLYGISKVIKNFKILLELILSLDAPTEEIMTEEFMESVSQAKELYGLIHNRFISTSKGLALIREKYLNGVYGHCPRILCDKQILLPVGLSEDLKYSRVKVFCPKCEDIYKPRQKCSDIDGAFFGSSFPHTYPDLNPKINPQKLFIPKLYGFKIFGKKGSKYFEIVKNAKKYLKERSPPKNDREKHQLDDFIKKFDLVNIS